MVTAKQIDRENLLRDHLVQASLLDP